MRITIGNYKGLTVQELVERDPGYAEWFWQHADGAPTELRREVRTLLAESRLARLSDQYDRLLEKSEAMKRQHARDRIRVPSAEEINFEKVRADGLQRQLADAYRMIADKDREMGTIKETFKKLRTEYARTILPPCGGSGSSSTAAGS
jgi:hypothetical protein